MSIIKINNLSKCYRIGAQEEGYSTIREAIMKGITAPFRNFAKLQKLTKFKNNQEEEDMIWALKDISLEVEKGEVLGIIGRNGSGKTTLLKILSSITSPTKGLAELHGRVSSLLEVGTGFHPELTGRENIFLNGAILGMKKKEIKKSFDDIVAFSEIGKFIDTPVKRYSNGMWVRLAFAVAAYLQPEILLIDEVLAVGDIAFQKKCLGRTKEAAKGGRTVLFVSHNMGAVRSLCQKAIWLDKGQIIKKGEVNEVVRDYERVQMNEVNQSSSFNKRDLKDIKNSNFYISSVEMINSRGEKTTLFRYNDKINLIVNFNGVLQADRYSLEFHIYNELGQLVSQGISGFYHGKYFSNETKNASIEIGPLALTSGKYRILLKVMTRTAQADIWENAIGFDIIECQPFATSWEMSTLREGTCVIQHSFKELKKDN